MPIRISTAEEWAVPMTVVAWERGRGESPLDDNLVGNVSRALGCDLVRATSLVTIAILKGVVTWEQESIDGEPRLRFTVPLEVRCSTNSYVDNLAHRQLQRHADAKERAEAALVAILLFYMIRGRWPKMRGLTRLLEPFPYELRPDYIRKIIRIALAAGTVLQTSDGTLLPGGSYVTSGACVPGDLVGGDAG